MKPARRRFTGNILSVSMLMATLSLFAFPQSAAAQSCRGGYCGGGDIEGDARIEVHVTIAINPVSAGTVLINGKEPANGVFSTLDGETLTIEAVADSGYAFDHWSDWFDESSSVVEAPIYNHKTLTANFVPEAADSNQTRPSEDAPQATLSPSIPSGTVAQDPRGNQVLEILVQSRQPRALPSNGVLIGGVLDFKPDGATFDPPLPISLPYELKDLPDGVIEEDLFVAAYDSTLQDWIPLPSLVNSTAATVEAEVSHLSEFAVVAPLPSGGTPLVTPGFSFSSLSVSPLTACPGQDITVNVVASYAGINAKAKSRVFVTMDGQVAEETVVSLSPGDSILVRFTVQPASQGDHRIEVSGLHETIIVEGSKPALSSTQEAIPDGDGPDRFVSMDHGSPSPFSGWSGVIYIVSALLFILFLFPLISSLRRKLLRLKYDL